MSVKKTVLDEVELAIGKLKIYKYSYCNVGRVCDLGLSTLIYSRQIKSLTVVCTYSHLSTTTHSSLSLQQQHTHSLSTVHRVYLVPELRSSHSFLTRRPVAPHWTHADPSAAPVHVPGARSRSRPVLTRRHTRPLVDSTHSTPPMSATAYRLQLTSTSWLTLSSQSLYSTTLSLLTLLSKPIVNRLLYKYNNVYATMLNATIINEYNNVIKQTQQCQTQ
jgi:hypothetical protein